jgi:peroxiredoxin
MVRAAMARSAVMGIASAAAIAAAVICVSSASAAPPQLEVGRPVPRFALDTPEGAKILSSRYQGKALFINFFATWCRPCKMELRGIADQYPHFSDAVAFLGVDEQEAPDVVAAFARRMGVGYEVAIDQGNVAADFSIRTIPESVFVDRFGIVRAVNVGMLTQETMLHDLALISHR